MLGFDILLDHKARPYLIEVNHAPSFATDSILDARIKHQLISDTMRLLNLSLKKKHKALKKSYMEMQKRVLTGKLQKLSAEEWEEQFKKFYEDRGKYEAENKGGFKLIFPCENKAKYEKFIQISKEVYETFMLGKKKKEEEEVKRPIDKKEVKSC